MVAGLDGQCLSKECPDDDCPLGRNLQPFQGSVENIRMWLSPSTTRIIV